MRSRSADSEALTSVRRVDLAAASSVSKAVRADAERIVLDLFDAYFADPAIMPEGWREVLVHAEDRIKARHVADFLAGMTDTYAIKEHRRLFDHTPDLG